MVQGVAHWQRGVLIVGERRIRVAVRQQHPIAEGKECRAYIVDKGRIRLLAVESLDPSGTGTDDRATGLES